jgi:predicted permease
MTLWTSEPGFDSHNVLTFRYTLPASAYPEPQHMSALHEQLVEQVAALPEVESAGAINVLPLAGDSENWGFTIDGRSAGEAAPASTMVRHVSPGYLESMRIRLLDGRALHAFDRAGSERVVVVSKAMAATYWPGENPIDRHIRFRGPAELAALTWRVVGIADDVPGSGLDRAPKATAYLTHTQWPFHMASMSLTLRTTTDPTSLVSRVRAELARIDGDLPIFDIRTMDEVRGRSLAQRRFGMLLLGLFAGVALVLALVGLYGTIAYTVSLRTREIGIRMALGARPGQILAMTVGQGIRLSAVGVLVGLLGGFALTRYLSSLLFGVSGADVPTFAGVSAVLLAVATFASWIPARRAARIEPVLALRRE